MLGDSRHRYENIEITCQTQDVHLHCSDRLRQPPCDLQRRSVFGIKSDDIEEEHPSTSDNEVLRYQLCPRPVTSRRTRV